MMLLAPILSQKANADEAAAVVTPPPVPAPAPPAAKVVGKQKYF
jgi:hypothetical protein